MVFWIKKNERDQLLGKEIKLYAQNEKSDKKTLLSTGKIEVLNSDDPQAPDSDSVLKFNAPLNLMSEGKWKIDSYVDKKRLGTTILTVQ
ncbi:hypothetical protein [Niallia sp. 03133]|uniref:hypothetical protein n=1 Tax=Niallia sp. 03133 TaxID=3458060 RepID=UPI0040446683